MARIEAIPFTSPANSRREAKKAETDITAREKTNRET